jgi:hypothetical protein
MRYFPTDSREGKMAKHDEFLIEPRRKGEKWVVKKPHAEHASIVAESVDEAVAYAISHAPEGDIKIKGLNGKFAHIQKAAE